MDTLTSFGNKTNSDCSTTTRTILYAINPVGEMIHEKLQQEFPDLLL
jgi:hypothetical protein